MRWASSWHRSVAAPKFLASSRPRRPGAVSPRGIWRFGGGSEKGAEACVDSCARSVTHLRDALPRGLVVSLAPAADAAKYAADLGAATLMTTVAVVGLGLMGASFALALKEARPETVIVGSDTDSMTLRKALDRGIVASASADTSVAEMAEVIMIGAPIRAMRDVFTQLAGRTEGKVVTDMASTKASVIEWAAAAGIDLVGGHPMCGKETSGIDAADASLFKDAPWVLTRGEPVLIDLIEAVGAHPVVIDAETHDRLVAGVSHAAFLLSVGYVLALSRRSDWPEASRLAAGGFRDMSRLAAGDPELYAGVARTNRAHLMEQLDAITAELARLRRHLEADDVRLVELFEEAQAVRERWGHR